MSGMLAKMLKINPEEASFGARYHAQLYTGSMNGIRESFGRDNWTCQTCQIRLPEFMEVDHKVHKSVCEAKELTTICQFCHNLKHPLWASLRGRMRLIWLPGMPQFMITRMAWGVFLASYQENIPSLFQSAERIIARVDRREAILADLLGSSDAEGFFESLHTIRRFTDDQRFWQKIKELDGIVRFWPTAVNAANSVMARPSTALGFWSTGKFLDLNQKSKELFWASCDDPEEYLGKILNSKAINPAKLQDKAG